MSKAFQLLTASFYHFYSWLSTPLFPKSKIADIILTVGKTVRREKAQELFFAYFLFGESKVGAD